jgi:hypothetical protein
VRWWRHWLLGEETGIMDEPMLRAYMPDATAAEVSPGPIPGRWVAENVWPAPTIQPRVFHLGRGALHDAPQPTETARCHGDQIVGLAKVEWVPFAPTELPREQSADDARSLVFDSAPLAEDIEILGAPNFHVRVASDRPQAKIAVRLTEVGQDGKSWLVSYGLLNLTHRGGHEAPQALTPGRAYDVAVPLNFTAHKFRKGARIRAALSESLWPLVWPSPEVAALTIDLAATRLELPVRPCPPSEALMPIALTPARPSDPAAWPVMEIAEDRGAARIVETWPSSDDEIADIGETLSGSGPNVVLVMQAGEPLSCAWRAEQSAGFKRPGWDVTIRAEVSITASATHFEVAERLQASLNGEPMADVARKAEIPRRLM